MKIDFANLNQSYLENKEKYDQAIQSVIERSAFIMGDEVAILEKKLSEFTQAKYSITCSNGTDALLLAMMSLGIGHEDEVITSPFTFIATGETIAFLGAKPVFVDIDEETYNIDVEKIEERITKKTKAIIPVSLFGQMSDMKKINDIAKKYNLYVIEDGAQSFGAQQGSIKSCNSSIIGTTSFFPAKPLGCFGDGGALFTNDDNLADIIKSLRLHGQTKRYHHKYIGMGGRINTIQAAVLNVKIDNFQKDILRRQKVADNYTFLLKNKVKSLPKIKKNFTSVWAQYSIRVKNREKLRDKLMSNGIPTAVHYPKPLHMQECFTYLKYKKNDFPISETVSKEILSLPMNPYLKYYEQEYIVDNLIKNL